MMEKRVTKILDRYRVTNGRGFRLKDYDPGDTAGLGLEKTYKSIRCDSYSSILTLPLFFAITSSATLFGAGL